MSTVASALTLGVASVASGSACADLLIAAGGGGGGGFEIGMPGGDGQITTNGQPGFGSLGGFGATAGGGGTFVFTAFVATVPEPASLSLLVTGLFGLGAVLRRRRNPAN